MKFDDIQAYPRRTFRRYWRMIRKDPHFQSLLDRAGGRIGRIQAKLMFILSWKQFRRTMARLVDFIIDHSTEGISYSGLENIPRNRPAIYISTHRSTSLDPILFNHMLYRHSGETAYNAAGDNLLKTPWLGHLIRLNRGFIVRREVPDIEEKLEAAEKLSGYIRSLTDKGKSVWIAQRNGRAKDGRDVTDSAVPAMIKMAHRDKSWEEFTNEVDVIPVSISYEEIPLDTLLVEDRLGKLDKSDERRDSSQVVQELTQKKRRIHIHLSPAVRASKRSELVKLLDRRIIQGVRLWESNIHAASLLGMVGDGFSNRLDELGQKMSSGGAWIAQKLHDLRPEIREKILELYAQPVVSRQNIE